MKIRRLEEDGFRTYEFTCYEELKPWIDSKLEEYKKINRVRDEKKDRSYMRYKEQIESYLDYYKCSTCSEEDHEGHMKAFCRCEGRNIRVAKEQRQCGEHYSRLRDETSEH